LSGTELEERVAEAFRTGGYIVFARRNRCDILAVKPNASLAYLIECKDYPLSQRQQRLAVRKLNRNYTRALEILIANRLYAEAILRVLVAQGFSYRSGGILQFTPEIAQSGRGSVSHSQCWHRERTVSIDPLEFTGGPRGFER